MPITAQLPASPQTRASRHHQSARPRRSQTHCDGLRDRHIAPSPNRNQTHACNEADIITCLDGCALRPMPSDVSRFHTWGTLKEPLNKFKGLSKPRMVCPQSNASAFDEGVSQSGHVPDWVRTRRLRGIASRRDQAPAVLQRAGDRLISPSMDLFRPS